MKRKMLYILCALAVVFTACHNGSFDVVSQGQAGVPEQGGIDEHSHHPYAWDLQSDGSWKCSSCEEYIEGTTGAYISVIKHGQPTTIYPISAPYTYTNTTGEEQTVIIRTTGGVLNINAPNDTVWHYGTVDTVTVKGTDVLYDGYASILTELSASNGYIRLNNGIQDEIPLITVPANAAGHVGIEVAQSVYVEHMELDSKQPVEVSVEGGCDLINVIGSGTTQIGVDGKIARVAGYTVNTGAGYVIDNNGTGHYNLPTLVPEGGIYKIYNRLDMAAFKIMCNYDGNTFEGETVQLQNDINLSGLWEPIGNWTSGTGDAVPSFDGVFKGTFDGNDFAINDLEINASTKSYQALFGYISAPAVIQDLTVSGKVGCSEEGAGVVAYMDGGTISNVINNVGVSSKRIAGGVVGRIRVTDGSAITFDNCVNEAGINGLTSGDSGNAGVGGIVGELRSNAAITFNTCLNVGSVHDTNGTHVGGILGQIHSASTGNVTLDGCINTAAVYGGRMGVLAKIGGIMGANNSDNTSITVAFNNCNNNGRITSSAIAGGILGHQNAGNTTTFNACNNKGQIYSTGSGDNRFSAGGIAGTVRRGSIAGGCDGGYAAIEGYHVGRLIGRIMTTGTGSLSFDTGWAGARVGTISEKTIGHIQQTNNAHTAAIVNGQTFYGKPYVSNNQAKIQFKTGTTWTWDGSDTYVFGSDQTCTGTVGTTNWTHP